MYASDAKFMDVNGQHYAEATNSKEKGISRHVFCVDVSVLVSVGRKWTTVLAKLGTLYKRKLFKNILSIIEPARLKVHFSGLA